MKHWDVVIVGAGIAGVSLAAELAPHASVLILEAEAHPAYHATGRSAAFWDETYGGPEVQPLTSASGPFLATPPAALDTESFLSPRGAINIGRREDKAALDAFMASFVAAGVELERLDERALQTRLPGLQPVWCDAVYENSCADIDVAGLHAASLKAACRAGAELVCNARLAGAQHDAGRWTVEAGPIHCHADILINAAGAWADRVADMCGIKPLGIYPYRRTIAQIRLDVDIPVTMPLVIDINGSFYFKPDGRGGLWLSPHDETPSEPVDAAPEELDVAVAIARLEGVTNWQTRAVTHKWAGLRSFAPDRLPVYGQDRVNPDFFWFAGQGGFGIQTAPAAAKLAASLITGLTPDAMVAGIDAGRYAPGRKSISG